MTIIHLSDHRHPTEADVNEAWEAYAAMAGEVVDNPKRLLDRTFFNEMTLREAAYKRKFLAWNGGR